MSGEFWGGLAGAVVLNFFAVAYFSGRISALLDAVSRRVERLENVQDTKAAAAAGGK